MRKRAEAEMKEMEEWQASQRKEQANKPVVWQGRAGGSKLTLTAAVATTFEAKEYAKRAVEYGCDDTLITSRE